MQATALSTVSTAPSERANLWLAFNQALAGRNFVCAVEIARKLNLDEQRIRPIQMDALRQFLVEFQNFDGAAGLCADYCVRADELAALVANLPDRGRLETQTTFSYRTGGYAYVSLAAQIRAFADRQIAVLRRQEKSRRGESWWQRAANKVRSWLDRLSNPWRGGGIPRGGLAWQ